MSPDLHLALAILFEMVMVYVVWRLIRWALKSEQVEHETRMGQDALRGLRTIISAPAEEHAVQHIRSMHPNAIEETLMRSYRAAGIEIRRFHTHNRYNGDDVQLCDRNGLYRLRAHKSSTGMHKDALFEFSEQCRRKGRRGVFITVGYGSFDAQLAHVSVISDRKLVSAIRSHPRVIAKFRAK